VTFTCVPSSSEEPLTVTLTPVVADWSTVAELSLTVAVEVALSTGVRAGVGVGVGVGAGVGIGEAVGVDDELDELEGDEPGDGLGAVTVKVVV
jgi:hypothetical protein